MRDPFAHDATEARDHRLSADSGLIATARRLWWLRVMTAIAALALLAGVWIVWRWV
jgi:hypothetical protein